MSSANPTSPTKLQDTDPEQPTGAITLGADDDIEFDERQRTNTASLNANNASQRSPRDIRIIDSGEEASLHPRAVWRHWRKRVIWDHRTYYGVLEFLTVFALIIVWRFELRLAGMAAVGLVGVGVLHWYANQRQSTHILARAVAHLAVLAVLSAFLLAMNIYTTVTPPYCDLSEDWLCREANEARTAAAQLLWGANVVLLWTIFVIYHTTRHPLKDPILAELPSPEDGYRPVWTSANVADGIEDDSPEVEGGVRL